MPTQFASSTTQKMSALSGLTAATLARFLILIPQLGIVRREGVTVVINIRDLNNHTAEFQELQKMLFCLITLEIKENILKQQSQLF